MHKHYETSTQRTKSSRKHNTIIKKLLQDRDETDSAEILTKLDPLSNRSQTMKSYFQTIEKKCKGYKVGISQRHSRAKKTR